MNKILSLIFISCLFFSCCKKDHDSTPAPAPEQLPPETQEGKNTFGCLVDGKVWLPKASFPNSALSSSYQSNVFIMDVTKTIKDSLFESFHASGYLLHPGQYVLNIPVSQPFLFDFRKEIGQELHFFITDSDHTGIVNLTKVDTIAGIIAGSFYFDAIDTITNQVIHVTDGRFDVKY